MKGWFELKTMVELFSRSGPKLLILWIANSLPLTDAMFLPCPPRRRLRSERKDGNFPSVIDARAWDASAGEALPLTVAGATEEPHGGEGGPGRREWSWTKSKRPLEAHDTDPGPCDGINFEVPQHDLVIPKVMVRAFGDGHPRVVSIQASPVVLPLTTLKKSPQPYWGSPIIASR